LKYSKKMKSYREDELEAAVILARTLNPVCRESHFHHICPTIENGNFHNNLSPSNFRFRETIPTTVYSVSNYQQRNVSSKPKQIKNIHKTLKAPHHPEVAMVHNTTFHQGSHRNDSFVISHTNPIMGLTFGVNPPSHDIHNEGHRLLPSINCNQVVIPASSIEQYQHKNSSSIPVTIMSNNFSCEKQNTMVPQNDLREVKRIEAFDELQEINEKTVKIEFISDSSMKNVSSENSTDVKCRMSRAGDENRWQRRFKELKDFKRKYGNCLVPTRSPDFPKLGPWVSTQRAEYKKRAEKKASSMTDERIKYLLSVGFIWNVDVPWEQRFHQLQNFKKEYGHCFVPRAYRPNPSLGRWVHAQRTAFKNFQKGKKSKISYERIKMLESIGFMWQGLGVRHDIEYEPEAIINVNM